MGKAQMELAAVGLVLASIVLWAAVSARATAISTPIFFVGLGVLFGGVLHLVGAPSDRHVIKLIAEVTLVWVLFADATRIRLSDVRADRGLYARLLGIGLPLTIVFGAVAGAVVLGLSPWAGLLVGASLAPTDAALGAAVMSDRRVPARVRHALNVESGLNDGIATPVVLVALAGVSAELGLASQPAPERALLGLLIGVAVGVAVGAGGGLLLRLARERGWSSDELVGPAVLLLALLAYVCAVLVGANGFVSAFAGGMAFGAGAGRGREKQVYYVEQTCGLASMVSWLLFGALAVPGLASSLSWSIVAYALLSLTVIRVVPVALGLTGTRIDATTVLFIGWFGPRGLASVVFALITLEGLAPATEPVSTIVATICFTVLLSVLAHGLSAHPLAGRYAASRGPQPTADGVGPTVRRLVGR